MDKIFVQAIKLPPVRRSEVLRYAAVKGENPEGLSSILDDCIAVASDAVATRACYAVLSVEELYLCVPSAKNSLDLVSYLQNASKVVLFTATVGIEIDRLLHRFATASPTKALLMQAIGAERIEAACDTFCENLPEAIPSYVPSKARFSAGYGDFPLQAQREIFSLLMPEKHIGVTLTESMLMSPTKSVTAVVKLTKV